MAKKSLGQTSTHFEGNTQCVQPQLEWSPQDIGGFVFVFGGVGVICNPLVHFPSLTTPQIKCAFRHILSAKPYKNDLFYKAQTLYNQRLGKSCWALGTQDILSLCPKVYYPLTLAALGHPSARAVLQMPPLNLGTVSLFARRDPRNQTAETTGGGQSRTKACWEVIVQL